VKLKSQHIFFYLFLICADPHAYTQDLLKKYIHLPPQELTVEQYLYHIEEMTGCHLGYSSAIVDNKRIALYPDSIQLKELLDTLFASYSLQYVVKDNLLILSPQTDALVKSNLVKITGVVIQEKSEKPVPFAAVHVPGSSTGTISNYEGGFELNLPADAIADTLMISCIGYKPEIILSEDFLTGPVKIKLQATKFQIEELIVRPEKPKELILAALDKKGENYGQKPTMLTAFFREASKQNDNYISISEAVIDIYKTSYLSNERDLVKLRKGRRGMNTENSELINLIVEGGLYHNIQLDIMKYGVHFFDPEFFENYDYFMLKQITYNERQTYVIGFRFKDNIPIPGFDGKFYLDAKSLALVRVEFEISEAGLEHAHDLLIKKVPASYRIQPKYGKYEVEYRYYQEQWNLNYARSEIALRVRKKRGKENKGFTCQFQSTSEFVITGKNTEKFEKIKYRDASKPGDILFQQITNSDPEFWGNETTILPEEPLLETIKKLRLQEESSRINMVKTIQ
jgi:hypothetical protein